MENRNYALEDDKLLQRARTLRSHFLQYQADFAAFDPDFNLTYADNWNVLINECEAFPTDEITVDEQQGYTDELEKAKKQGFTAADDIEYYVKKGFPDNKRIMSEFGFTKTKQARARTLNLIMWLFVMKKVANDYNAQLTAVGMPASVLTNLENAAENLGDKEIAQEYYKRVRIRLTGQRIEKYNNLFAVCKLVDQASESVFRDSAEHRHLFLI